MINLTNSSMAEDRYIAHMAGMNAGTKTIGFMDKFSASYAQKHPISNTIAAGIIGPIKGLSIATFGLMAAPFLNSDTRASIMGSAWSVCTSCGSNIKSGVETYIKVAEFVNPEDSNNYSYFEKKAAAFLYGSATSGKCAIETEARNICRGVNYAGSILDTLTENYMAIGVATAALTAYLVYSKMNAYATSECQAEESIKKDLTERYAKIATRLTALESNPEIKECATRILDRRFEIISEPKSLKLPSLSWKEIEQMTQPIFDAAIKLKQNS